MEIVEFVIITQDDNLRENSKFKIIKIVYFTLTTHYFKPYHLCSIRNGEKVNRERHCIRGLAL